MVMNPQLKAKYELRALLAAYRLLFSVMGMQKNAVDEA